MDTYVDWENNLTFLLEHIRANGPYAGVLGFSQGSNIALLLTAIKESGCMPWLSFDFVSHDKFETYLRAENLRTKSQSEQADKSHKDKPG